MSESPQLGPFELEERIGEGGMGLVYRGRHRETGVAVAVKVIRRSLARDAREQFHREIQAHAELVHPGVVYLFEYGDVPEIVDVTGGEDLASGSPFVAMELADLGTVRDHLPLTSWEAVRSIAASVLDALAHSHARGLIHRDLKPENLLLFDDDSPFRVKLADFGIAHALGEELSLDTPDLSSASGTPLYMPPEQTRGRWREYGPWTDMYALGCIVWELVSGRPPFQGDNPLMTMYKHGEAERPALQPRFPVPRDLETWIHRAMAIGIRDRFQRAADAARALEALGGLEEPDGGEAKKRDDPGEISPTLALDREDAEEPPHLAFGPTLDAGRASEEPFTPQEAATLNSGEPAPTLVDRDAEPSPKGDGAGESVRDVSVEPVGPIPESWAPGTGDELPSPLVGTGLGLFGLRETPFVDRDRERDHIWESLRRLERESRPRIVLVTGESGTGKSRLAEWASIRAHELGAAEILRAVHTAGGSGPNEGVPSMVQRAVRGQKLDRGEFYEHLLDWLPPLDNPQVVREADARALTELVYPTDENADTVDGPRYRFSSPDQKYALVGRFIRRFAGGRPPLVWLDDAQWGDFAVEFASFLLDDAPDPPPALVIMTLRSDVLSDDATLRDRIEALETFDRCARLDLEALESSEHREFVDRLLPLESSFAADLANRTEGNPLFAKQLLGHLIERGQLRSGRDGFRLRDNATFELPDDIHDLWVRRLERLVGEPESDDGDVVWRALEMAAALGREVDEDEWRAVCRRDEIDRAESLRDALVERGLAERTDHGWAFAHALLVDSLERHARERGRWKRNHRRCAELLEQLYSQRPRQSAARRADHWVEAGLLESAIGALSEEFERFHQLGDWRGARDVLRRRERLLDATGVSPKEASRVQNDIDLSRCEHALGSPPETVLEDLEAARNRADALGDQRLLANVWFAEAKCRRSMAEYDAAGESAQRAAEAARRCGASEKLTVSLIEWGWSDYLQGNLDGADERFSEARRCASDVDDNFHRLVALRGSAWAALGRGEEDRARELFERILGESRECGYRSLEAVCLNGLGELARFDGEAAKARSCYQSFRALARELNRPYSEAISTQNLALAELKDSRFDAAADWLEEADRRFEDVSREAMKATVRELIRLAHASGVGDWSRFDALFEPYGGGWPDEASLEKDHCWLLEMAGDFAAEQGEGERAGEVLELAGGLWERLQDEQAVERVEAKVDALD